jgi:hypothetical protein
MKKRILLALALTASLGSAVIACNNPAGSSEPTITIPSTEPSSGASEMPSELPSAVPSELMSAAPGAS